MQVLIHFGLFPTTPSQPRMAVSIDLLAFYRALFERSCDAVNALASALNTHYIRRGFWMVNKDREYVQEPFRRGLGSAVQWYDVLQVEVEQKIETVLQACRKRIRTSKIAHLVPPTSAPFVPDQAEPSITLNRQLISPSNAMLTPGNCASILVQRCPTCFGGTTFGRSLLGSEGGDIHVATDGNFHHRHRRSAGDSPIFYDPAYFLPKSQNPPKAHKNPVPDEAIDSCEASYEAADGKKQKACMDNFDDTGLMALICRHDIPLFFTNIDSPGEQQKYSVTLIRHLVSLLPPQATVVILYDVGCVLARTLALYNILPDHVTRRLRFATTAMHAYGHEWACTERLWSRLIKLIGIERSSSIGKPAAVGKEMLTDLGDWIKRRLRRGVREQGRLAQEQIEDCGVQLTELQRQWASQKESQLSIRAHAPARLKKELDTVLALQSDVDVTDKAIQAARSAMEKHSVSDDTIAALDSLERTHGRLMAKVDMLYASLNVRDKFPELKGISLDFVRTLLLARDLKINIRKRAIGTFFEWDKLDRAVGGAQQALGTKLHQQTCKAISKRQPALMSAIRKFNMYCEQLEDLYDPSWSIPLPAALPTKLNELRNQQLLMEDVWISISLGEIPRWMEDPDVRDGIRAMLKYNRCLEEQDRLEIEADNLLRWYGAELTAVELALHIPGNEIFCLPLQQKREHILSLCSRWSNPLVSAARFETQTKVATTLAAQLSGGTPEISRHRLNPTIIEVPDAAPEEANVNLDHVLGPLDGSSEADNPILEDYLMEDPPDSIDEYETNDQPVLALGTVKIVWETPQPQRKTATRLYPVMWLRESVPQKMGSPISQCWHPRPVRINDVCINNCIPLLFSSPSPPEAHRFAVFSTHDLTRIRYNAPDEVLWKASEQTMFWSKDVWIIPIHRPSPVGHWVLCVAHFSRKELLLFDSLSEMKPWRADVQDIMKLITRLLNIAKRKNREIQGGSIDWIARPTSTLPLQTNGHDCGIWVLATIAAVLRGYDATGLKETDMPAFRHYLRALVLSIPVF
ncbi:hypothetical protein BU15DRAFT_90869 [Melanogaster broomeanus]|nr:hypothetical protein BU15DRAFT_90869 [Melanogaster broomeanus]